MRNIGPAEIDWFAGVGLVGSLGVIGRLWCEGRAPDSACSRAQEIGARRKEARGRKCRKKRGGKK